jgi:hypothetical protein
MTINRILLIVLVVAILAAWTVGGGDMEFVARTAGR